jgi:hypothetical protein
MSTRRRFIEQLGGLAATLGFLPVTAQALAPARAARGGVVDLDGRALASRLGDTFTFQDPRLGTRIDLALVAVRPGPSTPHLDQFALIFRGDVNDQLPETVHWVRDPRGGGFPLLALPSGETAEGRLYRADCARFV